MFGKWWKPRQKNHKAHSDCCREALLCGHEAGKGRIGHFDGEGLCCRERTLKDAREGECVTIAGLRGEEGDCRRLREMGFCESATVEKLADSGALICRVCDARVVLSRRLAQSIVVQENTMSENIVVLSQMAVGQKGVIRGFVIENEDCERVEEMGLTPGEAVEIIRYAPLGDPIEIKIRGYCLSLRKDEADVIQVALAS